MIADASVPDAEIDAFVEEFQATFVPEEEVAAGPAPETVEVDGAVSSGLGAPPLIFIPGFAETSTSSVFNQRLCPQTVPFYALDMPGCCRSGRRTWERATWTSSAGFLDEMGIEKAHLAGHSIGGAIAGTFALAHPERVASSSSSLALVWERLTPTTSRASSRPTGAEK